MKKYFNLLLLGIFLFVVLSGDIGSAVGIRPAIESNMTLIYISNTTYVSATTINDSSQYGNNGTLNNTSFSSTAGIIGDGALFFNGVNSTIYRDGSFLNYENNPFSISFWINTSQLKSNMIIFSRNNTASVELGGSGFYIRTQGGGDDIQFLVGNSSGGYFSVQSNVNTLTTGMWHNVVTSYNGSQISIYIDGSLSASTQINNALNISQTNTNLYIGGASTGTFLNGSLTDILIYNRSLARNEITLNYLHYIGDCGFIPYNGCTISQTTNFNTNTYLLNGSSGFAIQIVGSNIIIDGNGSTFIGNKSSYGLYSGTANNKNITIKNFNIKNYSVGIFSFRGKNFTIFNNSIMWVSSYGISMRNTTNANIYSNILNNDVDNTGGIDFYGDLGNNQSVYENSINGFRIGIEVRETNPNSNIYLNNVTNSYLWPIVTEENSNFTNIYNNRIINSSWNGIIFLTYHNNIYNNYIENFLHNGIDTHQDNNIIVSGNSNIYNNFITQTSSAYSGGRHGLHIQATINNSIYNNTLYNLINNTLAFQSTRGIFLGSNITTNNRVYDNNLTNVSGFCLWSGDNSSTWTNNYMNNCRDDIMIFQSSADNGIVRSSFYNNLKNSSLINVYFGNNHSDVNFYGVNYDYYLNANFSSGGNFVVHLYNKTNYLAYYSNGSIACSNINSCDGNINITLSPNNFCYILDNFNLTEGVSRQNSPLNFTSSTQFEKTITSSLNEDIITSVSFNVNSCSLGDITLNGQIVPKTCSNNVATISSASIQSGSNQIEILYSNQCDASTQAGYALIKIFYLLALIGIVIGMLVIKAQQFGLEIKDLLVAFIIVIVGLVLFPSVAQNLGGCT